MDCSGWAWIGTRGRFNQSQRTELYRAAAKKLLANGTAFLCYCPAEKYAAGTTRSLGKTKSRRRRPRRVTRCSCRDGKPSNPEVKQLSASRCRWAGRRNFSTRCSANANSQTMKLEDFVLLRSGRGEEEFGQSSVPTRCGGR